NCMTNLRDSYSILQANAFNYLSNGTTENSYKSGLNLLLTVNSEKGPYDIWLNRDEIHTDSQNLTLINKEIQPIAIQSNGEHCINFFADAQVIANRIIQANDCVKKQYAEFLSFCEPMTANLETDFSAVTAYVKHQQPHWIAQKLTVHIPTSASGLPVSIDHITKSDGTHQTMVVFNRIKKIPGSLIGKGGFTVVKNAVNIDTAQLQAAKIRVEKPQSNAKNSNLERFKNDMAFKKLVRGVEPIYFEYEGKPSRYPDHLTPIKKIVTYEDVFTCTLDNFEGVFVELHQIFLEAAEDLQSLHKMGIIHNDIKGSNYNIDDCEFFDFEFAEYTTSPKKGALGFTPEYLPPGRYINFKEANLKEEMGQPSDVFAFGAMILFQLTGMNYYIDNPKKNTEALCIICEYKDEYFDFRIQEIIEDDQTNKTRNYFLDNPLMIDLLRKILTVDHTIRIDINDVVDGLKQIVEIDCQNADKDEMDVSSDPELSQ
ncbi:MAG: serine/threonine protein kinase, partial [Parachlamydiales bacterium]|nr:serine/threonine protein kinase [Parachlamydiales bacterium]